MWMIRDLYMNHVYSAVLNSFAKIVKLVLPSRETPIVFILQ